MGSYRGGFRYCFDARELMTLDRLSALDSKAGDEDESGDDDVGSSWMRSERLFVGAALAVDARQLAARLRVLIDAGDDVAHDKSRIKARTML